MAKTRSKTRSKKQKAKSKKQKQTHFVTQNQNQNQTILLLQYSTTCYIASLAFRTAREKERAERERERERKRKKDNRTRLDSTLPNTNTTMMLTPTNKLNNSKKNNTTTTTTTTTTDKEKAKYVWDTSDIALAEVDQSYIFSVLKKKCYEFPLFSNQEIHTGKILGKGGFSNVYEIINIELLNKNEPELEQPIIVNNNNNNDNDNETKNNYYDLNNYSSNSNINLNLNLNDSSSTSLKSSLRKCHHTTAIDDDNNNTSHYDIKEARLIMKQHVTRFGLNRYAIKRLRPDLKSELDYARGSIDLAIEIKFMSVLVHPNIVKMRGISNTIQTAEGGRVSLDTFIIMDRLYGTLEDKINTEWIKKQLQINMEFLEQSNSCCSFFCGGGCFGNKTNKNNNSIVQNEYEYNTNQLLKERLLVAYDLTVAFQYMHSLRLVYRDIKPQNIGFDIRGDVKIFDFGLMKSMDDRLEVVSEKNGIPAYKLTGFTGSIPYMAPEIALRKPYNEKCDVFSFSMLFWEIITLEFLFPDYRIKDYYTRVCQNNERPSLVHPTKVWNTIPQVVKTIIVEGWSIDSKKRPDMKRIGTLLRGLLNDMVIKLKASEHFGLDSKGEFIIDDSTNGSDIDAIKNRTQHMMNRSHASKHGTSRINEDFDDNAPARNVGKKNKNKNAKFDGGGALTSIKEPTAATTRYKKSPKRTSNGIERDDDDDDDYNIMTSSNNNNPNDAPQSSKVSNLTNHRGESVHNHYDIDNIEMK